MVDKMRYFEMYKTGEINSYRLADLLDIEYDAIRGFILSNDLKQIDKGALYTIHCPNCGKGWIVPFLQEFTCEECNVTTRIDYANI